MNLASRLNRIEQSPVAVEARKKREARVLFLALFASVIDESIAIRAYLNLPESERERRNDVIEAMVLTIQEYRDIAPPRKLSTEENQKIFDRASARADRMIGLEWYGRELTDDDIEREREIWSRVQSDLKAGIPSGESQAAEEMRRIFQRWPRVKQAQDPSELEYPMSRDHAERILKSTDDGDTVIRERLSQAMARL